MKVERPEFRYFLTHHKIESFTKAQLQLAEHEVQKEVMREWFSDKFDRPDDLPYDSQEGGYQFIWGGPFDAREELQQEFEGTVPDEVIEELADDLNGISDEWSGKPYDDQDDYLYRFTPSGLAIHDTFQMNLRNIQSLLSLQASEDLKKHLYRLCFANVITAFETYLADTFIAAVRGNTQLLERFVESNPDFQQEKFPLSEVFKRSKEIEKKVFTYLSSLVWHNLAKVMAMYKATLDVTFPTDMDSVHKAIVERHDIVHRNGKSTGGTDGSWGEKEVLEIMKSISQLVQHVENQIDVEYPF